MLKQQLRNISHLLIERETDRLGQPCFGFASGKLTFWFAKDKIKTTFGFCLVFTPYRSLEYFTLSDASAYLWQTEIKNNYNVFCPFVSLLQGLWRETKYKTFKLCSHPRQNTCGHSSPISFSQQLPGKATPTIGHWNPVDTLGRAGQFLLASPWPMQESDFSLLVIEKSLAVLTVFLHYPNWNQMSPFVWFCFYTGTNC